MPLLYAGPAFDLPAHSRAVGLLCVCLDGEMVVQAPQAAEEGLTVACSSTYIEPGTTHHIRFEAERIACLYVDPFNAHLPSITAGMQPVGAGVRINHPRRSEIIDILTGPDALSNVERAGVAEAIGLPPLMTRGLDPRIAEVMTTILSDPAQPHRAARLARQVGLSESRLRHAFSEAPGMSLKRFRLWARMGSGLSLIGSGANLTRAAHEAGFSSSAHFSTAYRALFGLKPSAVVRANPLLGSTRGARPQPA